MAVTPTYTPLGTITLASTDSEIVFSSIPATYRDLILVAQYNIATTGRVVLLKINGSSTGSFVGMRGNGSTAVSSTLSTMYFSWSGGTTANLEQGIAQVMDYSATDKHKTILVRTDNAASKTEALANRWASTAAVTSVALLASDSDVFTVGSTFSLYGIH